MVVKDDFPEEIILNCGMNDTIVNQAKNIKCRSIACLLKLMIKMI